MPNPHNPDHTEKPMSSNRYPALIFDIETGPRRDVIAEPALWCKADARLTDPKKIAADLADKANSGALSPITGEVLAIGYSQDGEDWCDIVGNGNTEKLILDRFLTKAHDCVCRGCQVVGFNSTEFDLPFLLLRARVNRVRIPPSIGGFYRSKFQPADLFVDLMTRAQFGRYDKSGYGLDKLCRLFGIEGKNGNGAMFYDLLATDPEGAKEYLLNDIRCTRQLAEVLL